MGCNTSTEQVLAANGTCTESLDNENNVSMQKLKTTSNNLDNNENQKISKNDNDLQIEDYGHEEEEAAVKIQSAFRGHKTRAELKAKTEIKLTTEETKEPVPLQNQTSEEELEKAATKIQASYRGHKTRAELKQKAEIVEKVEPVLDHEELEQQAAVKIQAVFRGHKTRATMKNHSEPSNTQTKSAGKAATSPTVESEPTKEELEQEFDPNDKELCNAASKIQATFRGHLTRKLQTENGKLKEEDVDIDEITKKVAEELDIDLSDPELNVAATKIQASFRGHKVRKQEQDVKQ